MHPWEELVVYDSANPASDRFMKVRVNLIGFSQMFGLTSMINKSKHGQRNLLSVIDDYTSCCTIPPICIDPVAS
jgi:hypothetical protein